jgi:hypothetical protein
MSTYPVVNPVYPYNTITVQCPPVGTPDCPGGYIMTINTNDLNTESLFYEPDFKSQLVSNSINVDHLMAGAPYSNAYALWAFVGIRAGYSPSRYYDETTYIYGHPDVQAMVRGQSSTINSESFLDSAEQHWLLWGRDQLLSGTRNYTFTIKPFDILNGDPYAGGTFVGTEKTLHIGDKADGGNTSYSTITLTLAGNPGAATISNMGTMDVTATKITTLDATNFTNILTINNQASTAALSISNLNMNPILGIHNTALGLSTTYTNSTLSGNGQTAIINLSSVTGGTITLNHTSNGYFADITINSNGSTDNNLTNLTGSALVGTSLLTIGGIQDITLTIGAAVDTIRTVNATPKTALSIADTTTGTSSNLLTATFSTANSSIAFLNATTLAAGNTLTFTGANNSLYGIPSTITGVSSNIGALFTNLDTLGISTSAASGTVNIANFGSSINKINIDVIPISTLTFNNVANDSIFNLGTSTIAPAALGVGDLVINQASPSSSASLTFNILGSGAGVADNLAIIGTGTASINVSSTITGTQTFTITSGDNSLHTLHITGGNTGNNIVCGTLPTSVTTFNGSTATSSINVTIGDAITSTTTYGSLTATNTITGGSADDTIDGGTANDIINGKEGANTLTGHGGLGATATDINTYIFTDPTGITTITDFNDGTSSSALDLLHLAATLSTATSSGFVGFLNGDSTAVTGSTAVSVASWDGTSSFNFTADQNIVVVTGTIADVSALSTAIGTNKIGTTSGNWSNAAKGLPFVYSDGTNLHIATVQVNTNSSQFINASASKIDDIISLSGISSTANFDSTDFAFIA